MSHFDDIEPVFYGGGDGGGGVGAVLLAIVAIAAVAWAVHGDAVSADTCAAHGEKYIDSRSSYTLCEQDGGTVVRR